MLLRTLPRLLPARKATSAFLLAVPARTLTARAASLDAELSQGPQVSLKGQLESGFAVNTSPAGSFARAPIVVRYKRGQQLHEDRYEVEVYGDAATTLSETCRAGDHVAVDGSLHLELIVDQHVAVVEAARVVKSMPAFNTGYGARNAPQAPTSQAAPAGAAQRAASPRQAVGRGAVKVPVAAPPQAQPEPAAAPARGRQTQPPVPQGAQQQAAGAPAAARWPSPSPAGAGTGAGASAGGGSGGAGASNAWLATASAEEKWQHVAQNPNAWFDNRTTKLSPNGPDFKLKGKGLNVALWITSKDTPEWAKQQFTV